MNPLKQLQHHGQSVWLDDIHRSLILNGGLKRLIVEDGLRGVTSNPTIFEKAIDRSTDYDESMEQRLLAEPNMDVKALYESLTVEDIRMAADEFQPVFEETQGRDGFVSIEVSPSLADDTRGSIIEARRLWREVDRPNLMIKIPATKAGLLAIEALLAEGINVNITLIFSLAHYDAVVQAFLQGAARCPEPTRLASVASVFVSRVDARVDGILDTIGTPDALALRGTIAIANARIIHRRFRDLFYGEAFASLRRRGVQVQRLLWASTGTKDPTYSDVRYVDELIGLNTITTVPLRTLKAFRDHGRVRGATAFEGLVEAKASLDRLKDLSVDLAAVTERLQQDGLAAFTASIDTVLAMLKVKSHACEIRESRS